MEKGTKNAEMEKDLMDRLSKSNLDKEQLSGISKSIAASHKAGLKLIDWWVFGVPPFEKYVIESQLPFDKGDIIQKLIKDSVYSEILLLKKGIPVPDFFNVRLTLENRGKRQK